MIGILVATHGEFGTVLLKSAEFFLGKQEQAKALSLEPKDSLDDLTRAMIQAIAEVDKGEGVLMLTDMFGGTPCNVAVRLCNQPNREAVAGLCLPMLIEAISNRVGITPLALAERVCISSRQSIVVASAKARQAAQKAGS